MFQIYFTEELDEPSQAYIHKQFIIEEQKFCKQKENIEIIVYVHSAIYRVERRKIIRETWGSALNYNLPLSVVFMVGKSKNDTEAEIVRRESEIYHDIVQGNYTDGYKLLTYKALNALFWVNKHCDKVPWTMHADDDIMVNDFLLLNYLNKVQISDEANHNFLCKLFSYPPVLRKGTHRVSFKKYKHRYYPPFCQGPMWLIRTNMIPKLLNAVNMTEFWWIDDLYLTGFLAKNANIGRIHLPYLTFTKNVKGYRLRNIATLMNDQNAYEWWNKIVKKYTGLLN